MTVEAIARRYGVLPTAVLREDADYLLRHINILNEAKVFDG